MVNSIGQWSSLLLSLTLLIATSIVDGNVCMRKVYDLPTIYGQHHIFLRHIPGTDRYILFQESGAAKIIKEGADAISFDESEEIPISFGLEGKLDSNGKVRGILFHPSYATNKRVFVYYMCDKTNPACVIQNSDADCDFFVDGAKCCAPECLSKDGYYGHLSEFRLEKIGDSWTVSGEIAKLRITFPDFYHAGGGMVFDGAGKLILGVGDGSAQNDLRGFAQLETNIRGKMIRIDVDNTGRAAYGIPADNPYVGNVENYDERIWSSGIRQPFRCSYDSDSDSVLCGNVGETSIESVYKIEKAKNNGWGRYEGTMLLNGDVRLGFRDSAATVNFPIFEWCRGYKCDGLPMCYDGSCGQRGSAVIGGFIYRGSLNPEFYGKYFCSDWHPEYPDIYVLDPATGATWSHVKISWQQPGGQLPGIYPTYQLEPGSNGDILMLNSDGIYRMISNADCGISNGLDGGSETLTQIEVNIPYVQRPLNSPSVLSSASTGSLSTTLRVVQTPYSIPGVLSFTTRTYDGSVPGPTFRVRAGDTVRVTLTNSLPANFDYNGENTWNTYHNAETTNLHLHGVHVSPEGKSDNVWMEVNPGETYEYVYAIPPDHSPGLNYYHAHHHGSTALQVQGGLYGAFIVEPTPAMASTMAPLLALDEHVIFLNIINLDPRNAENINSLSSLAEGRFTTSGTGLIDGLNYYILANGGFQPTITQSTALLHLRLVNTAAYALFLDFGDAPCSMYTLARDGVYLAAPQLTQDILLAPGNRADLLTSCSQTGTFALKSKNTSQYRHVPIPTIVGDVLFVRVASAPSNVGSIVNSIELPELPSYLDDLVNISGPVYKSEDLVFSHGYQINGVQLANENDISEIWLVNTVQQRTLSSVSFHPIHMHTNHFQIIDFSYSTDTAGNENVLFRRGEWRDTIPVMDGLTVTVRFLLDRFTGVVPTHCQVAGHQDQGMLRLARVVDESELTDDELRVFTTSINDYTTASQNLLGGVSTAEGTIKLLPSVEQGYLRLILQNPAAYYYNTFPTGFSTRESGVYMTMGVNGVFEFYSNYRQAGSTLFFRTPDQSASGTDKTALQTFFVPFSSVTTPLTFIRAAVNSVSFVVKGIGGGGTAVVEMHTIGFYRDLTVSRRNINVPPTPAPTAAPTPYVPHNRSVVLFANETAFLSDYSDDNTLAVSKGSGSGSEKFLQLDVTNQDAGYIYFTFNAALLDKRDGAYVIFKPSSNLKLVVELRTVRPRALKHAVTLGSETLLRGPRGDGYQEHLVPYVDSEFTSVVVKVEKGRVGESLRIKELGLFSYKDGPLPRPDQLSTILMISGGVLAGVIVLGALAWASMAMVSKSGNVVITREPSYKRPVDEIR